MPVITDPSRVPPPVTTPPLGVGRDSATWYAPDGTIWPLTRPKLGWFTLPQPEGIGAIPISMKTDANPRGGNNVRHIRKESRLITWPLLIWGKTHEEYVANWRALLEAFTQTDEQGPGLLEIAMSDGSSRRIAAYYQEGFDNDLPYATDGHAPLTLYCEKSEWQGFPTIVQRREYGGTPIDFLAPFPSVSSSQLLGDTTLVNPGAVRAWPTWTITGPATAITATLETTGESWTLDPSLIGEVFAAGDTVTIETDPPRIRNQAGDVWTGALNWPGAVLWALPKGIHNVSFAVSGADTTTTIKLEFPPLYRSA